MFYKSALFVHVGASMSSCKGEYRIFLTQDAKAQRIQKTDFDFSKEYAMFIYSYASKYDCSNDHPRCMMHRFITVVH